MRAPFFHKLIIAAAVAVASIQAAQAQRFLSDYDSTLFLRDTLPDVVSRFKNLHFSGYIQPQYQVASEEGAESWAGGDFAENADNRFMLRRARLKVDYRLPHNGKPLPKALFSFQIDATERTVKVRDMFVKVYDPGKQHFSVTAGLFAKPFGFEVNLSSSVRETPERGRMSQILIPSERGLGAMVSFEPAKKNKKELQLKWDAGVFNGPGLSGDEEFDSFKDIVSRLSMRPLSISENMELSAGLSFLYGGWRQQNATRYEMGSINGSKSFIENTSNSNVGTNAPRHYYGADVQLEKKHGWGSTELRGEYWRGTQPGTASTTVNPGTLPLGPMYIRSFDGAFFYFLQNIVNENWQLMVKYDWYDPNTEVEEGEIGKLATHLTAADIKFSTLGLGFTRHINENLKILFYYDRVWNEATQLPGYTQDIKDNVFTCRMQMSF
ncbi:MAG: porin [Chitinophagaceae bacterium]